MNQNNNSNNNLENWAYALILITIILFADSFAEFAADFLSSLF